MCAGQVWADSSNWTSKTSNWVQRKWERETANATHCGRRASGVERRASPPAAWLSAVRCASSWAPGVNLDDVSPTTNVDRPGTFGLRKLHRTRTPPHCGGVHGRRREAAMRLNKAGQCAIALHVRAGPVTAWDGICCAPPKSPGGCRHCSASTKTAQDSPSLLSPPFQQSSKPA